MSKRNLSPAALCAKSIRSELKLSFPNIKFSVRSNAFVNGDSVRVEWVNGLTERDVITIIEKYEEGSFNHIRDIYECSNKNNDIPQVKYIFASRDIEPNLMA